MRMVDWLKTSRIPPRSLGVITDALSVHLPAYCNLKRGIDIVIVRAKSVSYKNYNRQTSQQLRASDARHSGPVLQL